MSSLTRPWPLSDAECAIAEAEALALAMPRASLELLGQRALQSRQDWKFLVPVLLLPQLLERLASTHAALWAGSSVLAHYETQYFDTPDLRCFHDHRRGRPRRFKVRARTYADRQLTMLEVKQRHHSGTVKERMARPFHDHGLDADGAQFIAAHSPLDPRTLRPALANQFHRLTLLGVHAEQRVTLDLNLSFGDGAQRRHLPRVVIAEVKSACGRSATPALRAFAEQSIRPRSMSKYCIGTSLLQPATRNNRFLPILRALARLELP